MKRKTLLVLVFLLGTIRASVAQCAMCRGSVESSISDGGASMASSLNLGILYLFFTPYVVLGTLAFFWYRAGKRNVRKIENTSHLAG